MNSLKIPEAGVLLGVPDPEPKTQQAFTLDLSDDVIESMIRCHTHGEDISLALGANPTFHYGNRSHRIPQPPSPPSSDDEIPYDLFLTQPFKNIREATPVPIMSFWKGSLKPPKYRVEAVPVKKTTTNREAEAKTEAKKGLLQKPTTKTSKLSQADKRTNARALSASPALKPIASPSLKATASPSHSNGAADQAKLDRAPLIHELAVQPQTFDYLKDKWQGKPEDFNKNLEKVADQESGKWVLRAKAWQELDVWSYDYDSADREAVIAAAQKKYDKARISPSDPLWEKLVPKNERGQGKGASLSKVQKRIVEARGPAAAPATKLPKIAVDKADASPNSRSSKDDASDKSKGGESMVRTGSNKGKVNASEAQVKRLLGKTKTKPSTTKTSTPKTSPAKNKPAPQQTNGKKQLSAEFVENSDSSGDEAPAPAPKPKPVAKPIEKTKTAEKPAPKPKSAAPTPKPAPKPAAKSAPKRPLPADDEDNDSSSSSSTAPLAKRMKADRPQPAPQQRKQPRPDLRQPARDYSRHSYKNTSPTKSSPLAASPPTNVSDMSSSSNEGRLDAASKKRKADEDARGPSKRHQLMQRAQRFKSQYNQYADLHYEVNKMTHPPQNKLDELLAMHERLKKLKAKIYEEENLMRV